MPNQAGARGNTDRRNAVQRARLARSGALTAGDVPKVAAAAIRDLTRARAETRSALKAATGRLKACVLRQDIRYTGRATGNPAHLRWRSAGVCPPPAQPLVFPESGRAVTAPPARLGRLAQALQEQGTAWRLRPGGDALQALRGGHCPGAVPMVADIGNRRCCAPPRALLQCLGLLPSASSRAGPRRQGSMTQAGQPHARRALVEGAWAYRSPAKGSRQLHRRLEKPPNRIQASSWQAQGRRCKRSRRLGAKGKPAPGVTVAMARELAGFRGASARAVPVPP
jgi:transposase